MPARGRPANAGWLQEATIRGHMLGKTMLPGDEELGKKDDDHRFAPARRPGWSIGNHGFRWRRKRTLLFVLVLVAVYMLLGRLGGRGQFPMGDAPSIYDEPTEPTGMPDGVHIPKGTSKYVFDGSIRFYRLRSSIRRAAGRTNGYDKENRNVLFAASSLKSAATLLPVVCEMSHWSRNHVHMAFMGREDIPFADLLEINGIDKEKCSATWHDARPDYVEYSTDMRAERAVAGALSHLQTYLHPQAVIMDDSISEDNFFVRGIRNKAELLEIPLIEIPKDRVENFGWLTRLDAGSLRNWHSPTIDILIQVPSDSSNVLRLLNSIKAADYKGLRPPRLIFDVPTRLDQSVKERLQDLKWPPHNAQQSPLGPSGLAIRRRIEKASAVHHLELFYPSSTNSHVLLLTPQAELSPFYLHYVLYTLLEYRYSTFGAADSRDLMGISLQQPSLLLDEKSPLSLPTTEDMYSSRYQQLFPKMPSAPLLWQAPNSHATLYFGDKWAELHSFLTNRATKHKPSLDKTSISSYLPGWIEPMVEFMRARGYAVLYPAKSKDAFVTIHNDLMLPPDEVIPPRYSPTATSSSKPASHVADDGKPFLDADSPSQALRPPKHDESPTVPASKPIHLALPFDGDLPEIAHLPQLLYNGTLAPPATASSVAKEYADLFRTNVGGCTAVPKGMKKKPVIGEATDLFCFGDEDAEDWEPIEGYHGTEKLKVDVDNGNDEVPPTAVAVLPTKTVAAHKMQAKQTVVADEPDEF